VKNSKIIIIDDSTSNLMVIAENLKETGCEIIICNDSTNAYKLAQTKCPDLILLDIMMPNVSGFDLLAMFKSNRNLRDIPVIMISAKNDSENIVKCFELGAVDYITKPFEKIILQTRVKNHIRLKRSKDDLKNINKNLNDILEKKIQKIKGLEEKFTKAFLISPMIASINNINDLTYIDINNSFENILGYSRDFVIGKTPDILGLFSLKISEQVISKANNSSSHKVEKILVRTENGKNLTLLYSSVVLETDGEKYILSLAMDITERTETQKEMLSLIEQNNQSINYSLHDGVGQNLSYIAILVNTLYKAFEKNDYSGLDKMRTILELVKSSILEIKNISKNIMSDPEGIDNLSVNLEELINTTKNIFNIEINYTLDKYINFSDNYVAQNIYLIIKEALVNAIKHGDGNISITAAKPHSLYVFKIKNNIRDNNNLSSLYICSTGFGKKIMAYRADIIGAELLFRQKPNKFVVKIKILNNE